MIVLSWILALDYSGRKDMNFDTGTFTEQDVEANSINMF
jgi:hypothetical protein